MGKKQHQKRSNQSVWWVAGLAVVAVAVLIGMSAYSSLASKQKTAVASDADLHADRNAMGQSDARVTLVEWSDYL